MDEDNEVREWRAFQPKSGGDPVDLSFLNAHEVEYVHTSPGKADITYRFWVTYSFHCFAKDYPELTDAEREELMYHSQKDSRPFCYRRYALAKRHLKAIVLGLPKISVIHAGYGGYAAYETLDDAGNTFWYLVPFKVFRAKKKYRIHVTSAYPVYEKPGRGKVNFFTVANCLRMGRPLPHPPQGNAAENGSRK